ncbi:MAG: CRTAC1 family protein [Candidatus Kapaibacterium sp.]
MSHPTFVQRTGRRFAALAAVAGIYFVAQQPTIPPSEMTALANQFHFTSYPLPEVPGSIHKMVRAVHPSLNHMRSWISSVGAGVALNDIDGDGLANDLCYVDPRTDNVTVAPVPGTPARYQPFLLNPAPLPYDPSTMAPMGALPGDFNEDGLTDIMVYYWGRSPVLFLRNDDQSGAIPTAASYTPSELVTTNERWFTNCATTADLDGDGHQDIIIGNYFPDGAAILDAKGAGIQTMQHSMSRAFNGGTKHILLWAGVTRNANPSVRYNDAGSVLSTDVAHGWTLALGAADLDGDMLPEIYFSNDFGPDHLLHNSSTPGHLKFEILEGERGLTTPRSRVMGRDSFKGMGCDFADVNGDGLLDIFVSNIAGEYSLEESHFLWINTGDQSKIRSGIAPFVDRGEEMGLSRSSWGWDTRFGDFNNDGVPEALQATGFVKGTKNRWPELHELATSNDQLLSDPRCWLELKPGDDLSGDQINPFYAYHSSGRYYNVAAAIGLNRRSVSRGIATADVDGDGRLDFAVANQWDTSFFYHNDAPAVGAFLGLHLVLPISETEGFGTYPGHPNGAVRGRRAIGAQALIHMPDGRKLVAQVDGGNGHSGKRSPDLHFGLGNLPAGTPVVADITWRDGNGQLHKQSLNLLPGWHTVMLGSVQNGRVAS